MIVNLYKIIAIGTPTNIPKTELSSNTVSNTLNIVFAVAGAVALLIIVIAGLRLVMSQGNPEGLAKTRSTIIYALLGLLICISGAIIVKFVMVRI